MEVSMRSLFLAGVLALVAGSASAGLIVATGTDNTDTDNVISNECPSRSDGPAKEIHGCLNNDHNQGVLFTSDEDIKYGSGGQAMIIAKDQDGYSTLTISLTGGKSFSKLLLNIDADDDALVRFFAKDIDGNEFSSGPLALAGNGENKFTITGDDFAYVSFLASANGHFEKQKKLNVFIAGDGDPANDTKQVRIGGIPTTVEVAGPGGSAAVAVAEPVTLGLLSVGLLGVGIARRRKG
jgi:hypothetical protein